MPETEVPEKPARQHPAQGLAESIIIEITLFMKERISINTPPSLPSASNHRWKQATWLFPLIGLLSLIWFLVRVIPKPSRASYPCMRVAAPLASSFVVWILGLGGSVLALRTARQQIAEFRYMWAALCVAVAVIAVFAALH